MPSISLLLGTNFIRYWRYAHLQGTGHLYTNNCCAGFWWFAWAIALCFAGNALLTHEKVGSPVVNFTFTIVAVMVSYFAPPHMVARFFFVVKWVHG